ncbi:MAG: hypothetical protein LBM67_02745 [Lentimicrobiaceae bacterium]|jgi:hypothetical protein|nr:hypothetical protein [Lentimicrobiaceae bacterium]
MNRKKQLCDREFLSQLKESALDFLRHIDFLNDENIDVRQLDIDLFKKRIHTVYDLLCDFKPLSKSHSEIPSDPIAIVEEKKEAVIEEPIPAVVETTKEKDIFIRFESIEEPDQSENALFDPITEQTNVSQGQQKTDPKPIESIAERFVKQEDDSVAAKLQQQPIKELKSAIGINDKFLLLNELFSGSIEKYNKVMDEFEKFMTLNGARTFLLETKIDMQWDTQSEAYKKLESLLMRKYGLSI